ncbi:type II toxin-antitoxin system HipA family toxin [Laedolimicola ammoniilytica]|uniref:Type II toxin-antitoxin system HipA family toxin n=1 Tax=Laedolimicola ammoniilytica TaxID=2981771 RepID=A0ABT2RXS3_9FIRM|nr:type II toxin-antitoxin system HipA family toxin [Laedolimicola ammoniilytica]MCU6697073.1 type II toxin-antitoxin system HipA family toxin [Laedolimicola ammoniilytica]SCI06889.1 putative DNA-binding transcriptional regulator [uncultured Clostridium sp.]
MNTTAEVYLWGTRVGIIHQDLNKPYASFEYDADFLKSGIEISPVMMPLSNIVYEFPLLSGEPFWGMPGLVVDSLPDSFGNKVIEQWLASQGKSIKDFTAIDRLCYTGKRGMGALEYVPASSGITDINENINVTEMVKFASDVLNQRESITLNAQEALTYSQLVQVGSSAGGARAKALIAWNKKTNEIRSGQLNLDKDYDYWLMKFDNVSKNGDHGLEDEPEYTLIEYAYCKMALDAGIQMNECRIYSKAGENHFMTKRFDRIDGKKVHMQSLGAIAHISYKEPRLCSYEMAAQYMQEMNLPMKDIEQFYRRMVFNCIAVNQDDHVKNISFLMDRSGKWRLSPAYDMTFSYNVMNKWLSAHQMTVNGKKSGIDLDDLLMTGTKMGLRKKKCVDIISQVSIVVSKFARYAEELKIKEKTILDIEKILAQNKVEI